MMTCVPFCPALSLRRGVRVSHSSKEGFHAHRINIERLLHIHTVGVLLLLLRSLIFAMLAFGTGREVE
jgi:hypothetical protein